MAPVASARAVEPESPSCVLSETPLGDLMVRAGLNAFLSLPSGRIEQQEDDKQAEMMDAREGKIFQSICHPQFPLSSAGSRTDVMVDTGVLLSLGDVCVCVCLCMSVPAFVRGWWWDGKGMNLFVCCVRCVSVFERVVLKLSGQTVTICCLEIPADITHQTIQTLTSAVGTAGAAPLIRNVCFANV